jgi:hypothetical protein
MALRRHPWPLRRDRRVRPHIPAMGTSNFGTALPQNGPGQRVGSGRQESIFGVAKAPPWLARRAAGPGKAFAASGHGSLREGVEGARSPWWLSKDRQAAPSGPMWPAGRGMNW